MYSGMFVFLLFIAQFTMVCWAVLYCQVEGPAAANISILVVPCVSVLIGFILMFFLRKCYGDRPSLTNSLYFTRVTKLPMGESEAMLNVVYTAQVEFSSRK